MTRTVLFVALSCLLSLNPSFVDAKQVGVLIIAHGGSNRWNGMVRKAVKEAGLDLPVEVALGMGHDRHEARLFQRAVDRLERKGVSRIVVVPLLVSSHSEVFRQYEYLFGLRPQPEWPAAGGPLELEAPLVMGRALDESPVVAEILLERAHSLSRNPSDEMVILVAHGPNGDADNQRWLEGMQRVAQSVKQKGGFRDVLCLTLRDDAPKAIQDQATKQLREAVQQASQRGRVLVVPLLIAQGGIERKIPKLLAGLTYVYKGDTLLPHPKVVEWVAQQARELASASGETAEVHRSSTLSHPRWAGRPVAGKHRL